MVGRKNKKQKNTNNNNNIKSKNNTVNNNNKDHNSNNNNINSYRLVHLTKPSSYFEQTPSKLWWSVVKQQQQQQQHTNEPTVVSALVKLLDYPTPVREGPGSKPRRVKLYSVYSMDVIIIPPMTTLTLKETV